MKVTPYAGKPAKASMLVNVPRLVTAYYTEQPDPSVREQRVAFGASGHRGSSFDKAINECPSGTEDIYKVYAESFRGADHLRSILEEAQAMVTDALAATPDRSDKS